MLDNISNLLAILSIWPTPLCSKDMGASIVERANLETSGFFKTTKKLQRSTFSKIQVETGLGWLSSPRLKPNCSFQKFAPAFAKVRSKKFWFPHG
jgi:hypothetical protein